MTARADSQSREAERLRALGRYAILDTEPEQTFDELAALAVHLCDVPVGGIAFVDESRQWLKARVGVAIGETARAGSLADEVVHTAAPVEVRDLSLDGRRERDALLSAVPVARSYAAVPLVSDAADVLGVLFVVDHRARSLTSAHWQGLRAIARQVLAQLELRRQALARSHRERLLQTIIDSEPECVKLLSPDCTLRMMNPAGLRMIQADSLDQVVGASMLPLVAPEHRAAFLELGAHVFRGGHGSLEFRATGLKGATVWLETHAVPLRDDEGRVVALLGITRDVTDRKRANDALRQSEMNLRMLFDQATDGVFVADAAGALLDANRAACAMTGYTREELLRRTVRELVHPDELPRVEPEIARLASGEIITTEWRLQRKDGSVFLCEARAKQLPDGRLQAFCRDISDRKHAEMAQARLAQAHKMETVGRLAGGIAHDFNNLLTVINATADVVASDLTERDAHYEHLQQIQQAGDRAATLTRQLLALSRQQMVKPEVMSLNALVANMDDMLRRLIGEDVELRLELSTAIGNVRVDPGQIEQVVLNLVLNARDAMPEGGTLTITTEEVEARPTHAVEFAPPGPGPYVMLAVRDDGVGMDDATRARAFEPFFTTKEQGRGTGLGLSMVYGAVRQSGGTLRLQSAVGAGTTVALYLPKVEAPPPPKPAPPQPTSQRGHETVLIVEDESALRGLARRILQQAGYTVLEAGNGDEALDIITSHTGPIDLMFTDVVMPRMNGRVLASRLADIRPETKVLFASGYTDDIVLRRGVVDDPGRFLPKPYTATVLRTKIRHILDS